jgi:hypothetical protein
LTLPPTSFFKFSIFYSGIFFFSFVSVAIASLWFTSGMMQFMAIIAWYIGAIPTIGFVAAVTGVAIWYNNVLGDGTTVTYTKILSSSF